MSATIARRYPALDAKKVQPSLRPTVLATASPSPMPVPATKKPNPGQGYGYGAGTDTGSSSSESSSSSGSGSEGSASDEDTLSPSVTPTLNPTISPTPIPSALPTILPSAVPTVTPSVSPSAVPSAAPSLMPSTSPSALPSAHPFALPSAVPSNAPSMNPSDAPPAAVTVDFSISLVLSGLDTLELSAHDQAALTSATAQAMGVSAEYLQYSHTEESVPDNRRLFQVLSVDGTAVITASIPLASSNRTAEELYAAGNSNLAAAVANGQFNAYLQQAVVTYGAASLLSVTATSASSTPMLLGSGTPSAPSAAPSPKPSVAPSFSLVPTNAPVSTYVRFVQRAINHANGGCYMELTNLVLLFSFKGLAVPQSGPLTGSPSFNCAGNYGQYNYTSICFAGPSCPAYIQVNFTSQVDQLILRKRYGISGLGFDDDTQLEYFDGTDVRIVHTFNSDFNMRVGVLEVICFTCPATASPTRAPVIRPSIAPTGSPSMAPSAPTRSPSVSPSTTLPTISPSLVMSSCMFAGESLAPGKCLKSLNYRYTMCFEENGEVTTNNLMTGEQLWTNDKRPPDPNRLEMMTNGELKVWGDWFGRWSTGTSGSNLFVTIQNDGNLVVYSDSNQQLTVKWSCAALDDGCPTDSAYSTPATTRAALCERPSVPPTRSPSIAPSVFPSVAPTNAPTVVPTIVHPSIAPAESPSVWPSVNPTTLSSVEPSQSPSESPSAIPSGFPSMMPTDLPTVAPTINRYLRIIKRIPGRGGTCNIMMSEILLFFEGEQISPIGFFGEPDDGNTDACFTEGRTCKIAGSCPTYLQINLGSAHVDILAIAQTDAAQVEYFNGTTTSIVYAFTQLPGPYSIPINEFSITAVPSISPSQEPSADPTVAPTVAPSVEPSISPSAEPSVEPSVAPSVSPSLLPTVSPSMAPTASPTTHSPSVVPTISPTVGPTMSPSLALASCLFSGDSLLPGECLKSPNYRFKLCFEKNGELTTNWSNGTRIWTNDVRPNTPDRLEMMEGGNLRVWGEFNTWWSTGTGGSDYFVAIQNDGDFVVYRPAIPDARWKCSAREGCRIFPPYNSAVTSIAELCGSQVPSQAPSKEPTIAPTRLPTNAPISPSRKPTSIPTMAPSTSKPPTRAPSGPTRLPSLAPNVVGLQSAAVVAPESHLRGSVNGTKGTFPARVQCERYSSSTPHDFSNPMTAV